MIFTLIKKELRQLVPLAILFFVFIGSDIIYRLIDGRLDESSWSQISGYLCPGEGTGLGVIFVLFCFMMAFSLFPREHDERTIEFLYSLPVHRVSVFVAKFMAALFILEGALLLGQFLDWALQLLNYQFFSGGQFQMQIAVTAWFLFTLFIFVMLAYGVFLSFFRHFGLFIFGLYWWIVSTLEKISPSFGYLNFLNIVTMEYHGQTLLIPWRLLFINLSLAGISLLVAIFLWITPAEMFSIWYRRLPQKRWGRYLRAGSLVFSFILFLMIIFRLIDDPESTSETPVKFKSYESATFTSEHYRFTYPLNLRETAHQLIINGDLVYEMTRDILGAENTRPVVVDFTEKSTEHHGIAGLHKIRMDIRGNQDLNNRLRIFAHETSHVFALLESNRKMVEHDNETNFFNEGLAEYVSYHAFPDMEKLEAQRLLAVTAWLRHDITFEDLCDKSVFLKKYNENLFYAIGETWVNTLSEVCGKESLGNILRTMGNPDAPSDLSGQSLWRNRLQAMNCDLEKVNGSWLKQLNAISRKRKDEIERLPRIRGGVARKEGNDLILIANIDRPISNNKFIFIAQYRNSSNDDEDSIRRTYGVAKSDKENVEIWFTIPAYHLVGRRFEYQFGYIFNRGTFPYFEEWQSGERK